MAKKKKKKYASGFISYLYKEILKTTKKNNQSSLRKIHKKH